MLHAIQHLWRPLAREPLLDLPSNLQTMMQVAECMLTYVVWSAAQAPCFGVETAYSGCLKLDS